MSYRNKGRRKSLGKPPSRMMANFSPSLGDHESKRDLLKKFEDTEIEDDIFGQGESIDELDNEFKTIKIVPEELETLRLPFRKSIKFEDQLGEKPRLQKSGDQPIFISPTDSISTSSPKSSISRKGISPKLSDYSENDTDVTSQNMEDDFEDVDMIFGKEESGLYGTINGLLIAKKKQMQEDADREEMELLLRLEQINQQREAQTLKLDQMYGHEYEDDVDFEQGFENMDRLRDRVRKNVAPKISMPNFMSQAQEQQKLKRFKSVFELNNKDPSGAHPVFNDRNKIIKKLDRIPSFYQKPSSSNSRMKVLEKYKEQSPKKSHPKKKKRPMGFLGNTNDYPTEYEDYKMKYNTQAKKWEGNEIDLLKFETLQKPALITKNDLNDNNEELQKNYNMIYDDEKMKWINTEENDDIFNDIPDLEEVRHPTRGASTFTARTSSSMTESTDSIEEEMYLSEAHIKRFFKEEAKFEKHIEHWFDNGEVYNVSKEYARPDYLWEIRKLVMDTED